MMRAKNIFVCFLLLVIVVDSYNLNDVSDNDQKSGFMNLMKPRSDDSNSKDFASKFKRVVSELSSQFSAIKESVENLNRGGFIKKSSLPIPNVPVPTIPTPEDIDDLQAIPPYTETIPVEAIPDEDPLDFDVQVPTGLRERDISAIEQILLIESMLQESDILRLVENIQRSQADDTRYTAPPKTQAPDYIKPTSVTFESTPDGAVFESSPVLESRTFIEGRYSAAQISTISKIVEVHPDISGPELQNAYEQLVSSSKRQMASFFESLDSIPTSNVAKRDHPDTKAPNDARAVAINIDVIVTIDSNVESIPKQETVQARSEARGCLSDFIQSGSLVLSGNGMICQDGNEACKQCLYEIYQQAAAMRD